jgi:hypothetical protein
MLQSDIMRLSPAKLSALADSLGLTTAGKRGVFVMRKSATDPRTHREHPLKRSTKTTDLRLAVHRASVWWDEHSAKVHGSRLPTLGNTSRFASLEDIEAHYSRAASCGAPTRKRNVSRLRLMVSEMFPDLEPGGLSCEVLDGRMARQWQLTRKEKAESDFLPNDREGCEQAKRGANAVYRQARCVFSAGMLRAYEDAGLAIAPGAREFAKQGFLKAADAPPSEQISPEIVENIWAGMPALRTKNPAVFACWHLMFRGALRNSECLKARWKWLRPLANGDFLLQLHTQGDFKPKAKAGAVRLTAGVVAALASVRRMPSNDAEREAYEKGEDHLVPAENENRRRVACYRELGEFLRSFGVQDVKGKISYRLRGHAITEVILTDGLDAGRELARHSTSKTTQIYQGAAIPYSALGMPTA